MITSIKSFPSDRLRLQFFCEDDLDEQSHIEETMTETQIHSLPIDASIDENSIDSIHFCSVLCSDEDEEEDL